MGGFAAKNMFVPASRPAEDDVEQSQALAPPHPYPGWQPSGAGDPNALLAWIDRDLKGHDEILDAPPRRLEEEPENSEFAKPVTTAKGVIDNVERGEHVAEAAAEGAGWLKHGVHAASRALAPVVGPLGIAGGAMEIAEGIHDARDGRGVDGTIEIASGAAGMGSSGAGMASLLVNGAIPWAVGLGAASDGMKFGHYGDEQLKNLDRLHDGAGHAVTASQWAGETAASVHNWFADRGHPIVGHMLGVPTLAGTTVAAGGMAAEAAAESAGRAAGGWLGRRARVSHYKGYDVGLPEGAEALAHYDDTQEAAVERSKREHPERWGHNPHNPSFAQAFANLERAAGAESKK